MTIVAHRLSDPLSDAGDVLLDDLPLSRRQLRVAVDWLSVLPNPGLLSPSDDMRVGWTVIPGPDNNLYPALSHDYRVVGRRRCARSLTRAVPPRLVGAVCCRGDRDDREANYDNADGALAVEVVVIDWVLIGVVVPTRRAGVLGTA